MAAGDTLVTWDAMSYEGRGTNPPTPDVRNQRHVLDFALAKLCQWSGVLPRHYAGGGITIYLHYAMSSAVADDIKLEWWFERIGEVLDLDSNSFASALNTGDITVPGTAGLVDIVTIAFTDGAQIDGLLVGEGFRVRVRRIAVTGTDAAGDLELLQIEMRETV